MADAATTANPDEIVEPVPTEQVFKINESTVYKSLEELLEGVRKKDEFINQLKSENEQLRNDNATKTNNYNFVEEIKKMSEVLNVKPQESDEPKVTNPGTENIAELVNKQFEAYQAEQAAKANLGKLASALNNAFGTEVENKLTVKLSELNMSKDEVYALASKNPDAALKLLDIKGSAPVNLANLGSRTIPVSVAQPNTVNDMLESLKVNRNNTKFMADLQDRAMKDPSILKDIYNW